MKAEQDGVWLTELRSTGRYYYRRTRLVRDGDSVIAVSKVLNSQIRYG
ncbi:hypothetical protein OH492_04590 [Vibrio chagasii]|nr:hypothetical protein [Vibrio chagasii]